MQEHSLSVQIYYEDTDHSGVVYHANYLKYFERAREHMLGINHLISLMENEGIGFVVYKAEITYKRGAAFGDTLEIRSTVSLQSAYRLVFRQNAYLPAEPRPIVDSVIQLACVDENRELVPIPQDIIDEMRNRGHDI